MNVLIIGGYGLGNVGDNTGRDVLLDFLGQERVEVKWHLTPLKQDLIEWADLVLLGGGGLLYDSGGEVLTLQWSNANLCNRFLRFLYLKPKIQQLTQHRSVRNILGVLPFVTTNATAIVDNYMNPLEVTFQLGKPIAGIALGTGGIYTEYGKRRYTQTLSKLDLLTVRDPEDRATLESVGVSPKGGIEVCEDLGWLVKPPEVITTEFDIGWVIRQLPDPAEKYYLPIVSTIKKLKRRGFTQHILSFSRTDTHFLKHIAKEMDIPFFEDLHKENSIAELAKCRLIVANRFHAIIFSLLLHKPVVVPLTGYGLKNKRLLNRVNLPYSFSAEPLVLEDKILEVWQKVDTLQIDFSDFVARATRNLTLLGKLLRGRIGNQ